MTTTATHDTKRGEDARARLNVLSELADESGQDRFELDPDERRAADRP